MTVLNDWLMPLLFSLIRPIGMSLFFPLLKASNLGASLLRNGVLLAVMLPMLPVLHALPGFRPGADWLSLLSQEMLIGLLLGVCAAVPFWAVDMAGFLIDTLRGATMGTIFNPTMGVETSIFGLLFTQLLCVLFLISGGLHLLLSLLYHSYDLLPPGKPLVFGTALLAFFRGEWRVLYQMSLSFSLPAVLCMVLVDLALGLVNRSAQQLNVFFLSMPIKSAMALFLLLLSLPYALHHYLLESEALYLRLGLLLQGLSANG